MNVIFDMDGLMFDTEKVFIKAWDYAGERIGIGKAGYMVYKTLGMSIAASYEIWNEEFGDRYNQEELRKYTKEFLKKHYENENKDSAKNFISNMLKCRFLFDKYVLLFCCSFSTCPSSQNI